MSELPGVAVLGAGHMGADHIRRLDRVVSGARVDVTLRGQVTGPRVRYGCAASAVAEAGVRAPESGTRTAVELATRPALYAEDGR